MKRRILSLIMVLATILSNVPLAAFAAEADGLCEHHTGHTADCGYQSASEAAPCGHVHTDGCQVPVVVCVHEHGDECWQPGVDGGEPVLECVHTECTVYSGCVAADFACVHEHGDECWQPGENGADPVLECVHTECTIESGCVTVKKVCSHRHDDACGYSEGREEIACEYVCEACEAIASVEAMIEELPTAEKWLAMEKEVQNTAYTAGQNTADAYNALPEADQMQVSNAQKMFELHKAFNNAVLPVTIIDSGTCGAEGDNVTWTLDNTGKLTISGQGEMMDYGYDRGSPPWSTYNQTDAITSLVVERGVTKIGDLIFGQASQNLTSISIADTVTYIGESAFGLLNGLTKLVIPSSVEYLGQTAVMYAENMTSVTIGAKELAHAAFLRCYDLVDVTFLDSVSIIGQSVFDGCSSLQNITIPASVTKIDAAAFANCESLSTVTFLGNAPEFGANHIFGRYYDEVPITVYYPANNPTWTSEVKKDYGCKLTWVANGSDNSGDMQFTPANGAQNVGYEGEEFPKFQITYDKNILGGLTMDSGSESEDFVLGTMKLYRTSDNQLIYPKKEDLLSDPRPDQNITASENVLVWDLSKVLAGGLAPNTEYFLVVEGGFIRFEDGTVNAAVEKGDWAFKTKAGEACRLADLKTEDYLTFADLCYFKSNDDFRGKTVREIIGEEDWASTNTSWSPYWNDSGINNSERCANIENWVVIGYQTDEQAGGFGAYTFANDYGEAVIAFRGTNDLADLGEDIYQGVGGPGVQIEEAFQYAETVINKFGIDAVHITGHSLGGGLCDIVSARFGCKGVSINAAPFLENAYYYYPEEMGIQFSGTGSWQFEDHITDKEAVGLLAEEMKNYIIHRCNEKFILPVARHMPPSMLEKVNENVQMTSVLKTQKITWPVKVKVGVGNLLLGTQSTDQFWDVLAGFPTVLYGGNANDHIVAGINKDIIVGGRGDDILSGGKADDTYYYFKGDGLDTIFDVSGHDTIKLIGFNTTDTLSVQRDSDYVTLLMNEEAIIKIAKERASENHSFNVVIQNGNASTTKNITDQFGSKVVDKFMVIACPVNVEIINDATGEVVNTLSNDGSSEIVQCTDQGYFYVYPDDSGNYVKAFDLFAGHSVRIRGTDTGTMNVSMLTQNAAGEDRILQALEVPVSKSFVATVEEKESQVLLSVDTDGDGTEDGQVPLEEKVEKPAAEGSCGEAATWKLLDGTLTITGSGTVSGEAFQNRTDITSVVIEEGVTVIGDAVFSGCTSLESVTLPVSVTDIGSNAFQNCTALQSVAIPAGVKELHSCAFGGCSGMNSILFAGNAPRIAADAFSGVTAEVTCPEKDATWTAEVRKDYGGALTWPAMVQIKDGWQKQDGIWYYYKSGQKVTGWLKDGGVWYYLKADGAMATGWQKVGSTWYYLKSSGAMATGWQKVGGTWYYLKSSGAMATGWQKVGGTWYYFKSSGAMATGWLKLGSTWYYLKSSGAMATGRVTIGSTLYYFNSSGVWIR